MSKKILCGVFSFGSPHLLTLLLLASAAATLTTWDVAAAQEDEQMPLWQTAMNKATAYANSKKPEREYLLQLYRQVLDSNPPSNIQLHVRLEIGARMTILYDPELGEEGLEAGAIPWYESIVKDFADWDNHHDLMVAKIHLGDLYRIVEREDGVPKAEALYWEIVSVPVQDVVFDDPDFEEYNVAEIERSLAPPGTRFSFDSHGVVQQAPTEEMNLRHREELYRKRSTHVDALRKAAVRALANARTDSKAPERTLYQLNDLKAQRPDDELYQETVDGAIQLFLLNKPPTGAADAEVDHLVSKSSK